VPPGGAKGVIRFTGAVPPGKVLTMDAEEACQKLHAQPPEEKLIITGAKGTLANAFVYIKAGLPAGAKYPAPTQTVALEQKGCQFLPRVLAVRAGQVLTVKNADPVSHNIHPMPKNNYDWNQQQPPGAEDLRRKFARAEVMIPVKCNVHAWMRSYIAVMEHPFHAVTGSDGSFAFNGLPPGAYVLGVWHETLGEREEKLLVKSGETAEAAIAYQ
jgi:plastocyanin